MSKKARAGFTLIEMVFVSTIASIILVMVVSWINVTMKFASRIEAKKDQHQQLSRLASDFRRAVQDCDAMEIRDDNELHLLGTDENVVFSIDKDVVSISKTIDGKLARNEYRLTKGSVVQWQTDELPEKIGLTVVRDPLRNLKKPQPIESSQKLEIHVEAIANRRPVLSPNGASE